MEKSENGLSKADLQKLVAELEAFVDNSVRDVKKKFSDHDESQFYRSNMKGYAKGLWWMGNEIIERLKKLL